MRSEPDCIDHEREAPHQRCDRSAECTFVSDTAGGENHAISTAEAQRESETEKLAALSPLCTVWVWFVP